MLFKLNIWRILGIVAIILFAVLFFKIVIYLTISLVLFLIFYPVTYRLENIKIKNKRLPDSLASLITLVLIIGIFTGLFFLIIPPLATEVNFLSTLNFYDVFHNSLQQFPWLKNLLLKFGTEDELKNNITAQFNTFANTTNIGDMLNNIFKYMGTLVGGIFCVLFITFFLLKDQQLVSNSLLTITPKGTEGAMKDILKTSKKMLGKYFAGLFLDMLIVGGTAFLVLSILGIKNAIIIAFIAGVLNVIPYIGSAVTMLVAIFLGVSGCISSGHYELIGPTINKIFFTLLSINLIDGFIIQPFIFSSSVKAHPLEIFLVTLMAATLGGIFGMVVALPVYTIIRIVAKEFLTHLKFFKRISDTIEEPE
ncbi:MAG: AI-2E family transporter [Bacteroidota bacterium]|nr:AI-2E family transporter [Bacteroidota bacterium]